MSDHSRFDGCPQSAFAWPTDAERRLALAPWTSVPPKFCRFGEPNLPFATVLTPDDRNVDVGNHATGLC